MSIHEQIRRKQEEHQRQAVAELLRQRAQAAVEKRNLLDDNDKKLRVALANDPNARALAVRIKKLHVKEIIDGFVSGVTDCDYHVQFTVKWVENYQAPISKNYVIDWKGKKTELKLQPGNLGQPQKLPFFSKLVTETEFETRQREQHQAYTLGPVDFYDWFNGAPGYIGATFSNQQTKDVQQIAPLAPFPPGILDTVQYTIRWNFTQNYSYGPSWNEVFVQFDPQNIHTSELPANLVPGQAGRTSYPANLSPRAFKTALIEAFAKPGFGLPPTSFKESDYRGNYSPPLSRQDEYYQLATDKLKREAFDRQAQLNSENPL